jgi:nitrite reductase/ring-hydroxylating ferredoxin subunit
VGQRVRVGRLSDLEDDEITPVEVEGRRIALARVGDEVFAVEDRCTHRDCALSEGVLEGEAVLCPCHGSEFDLRTGEVLALPAKTPVELFETEIEGEDVYVKV